LLYSFLIIFGDDAIIKIIARAIDLLIGFVPFSGDETRLTMAFDVVPAK
jgi:hypothetical protein